MTTTTKRKGRIPNGARVHISSAHFPEQCDAVIRDAVYDEGWLYRVDMWAGEPPKAACNKKGEVWVCESEVEEIH